MNDTFFMVALIVFLRLTLAGIDTAARFIKRGLNPSNPVAVTIEGGTS